MKTVPFRSSLHGTVVAAASLLPALLSSFFFVLGADETVTWHYNILKKSVRGMQVTVKQCETATFSWNDGMPHDLIEITGGSLRSRKKRLQQCNTDGVKTTELAGISTEDSHAVIVGASTAPRYFFCSVGSGQHCSEGGMKATVRVLPDFGTAQDGRRHDGYACAAGGRARVLKNQRNFRVCLKKCKNNCQGVQYDSGTKECTLYKGAPSQGSADGKKKCWAARASCD